jgi:hypothetical protein
LRPRLRGIIGFMKTVSGGEEAAIDSNYVGKEEK